MAVKFAFVDIFNSFVIFSFYVRMDFVQGI